MKIKISKAPKASRINSHIVANPFCSRLFYSALIVAILLVLLVSCSSAPDRKPARTAPTTTMQSAPAHRISHWVKSDWSALPGWQEDTIDQAWPAWEQSCSRPTAVWLVFCNKLLGQLVKTEDEKRAWLQSQLDVYRIENQAGTTQGVLTSYYEPVYTASRQPNQRFAYPLYSPPATLSQPWYSRRDIDTEPQAQAALQGHAWAYLQSPISVLNLHIQGSGKLFLHEANGQTKAVRAAFAATNGHPFQSPLRWLVQQGLTTSASWGAAQRWADANPAQVPQMLWQNPRYVFFQEKPVSAANQHLGPVGAQGVPLTAGRSIAVDPRSIPYATPLWLVSNGAGAVLQRLVLAQDTGSAIVGAVRADYFAGSGPQAEALARRIHQPLQLWALWPKDQALP